MDFNRIQSEYTLPLQFGGAFLFSSLAAVVAGTPATYVQGYGNENTPYTYHDLSVFVQDEWRPSSKLTIASGLRYQAQFWPDIQYDVSDLNGARFRYPLRQERNDLAPRLSFSFDPRGNGRTAVHGSYGIFYDNQLAGTLIATGIITGSADHVRTLVAGGAVAQAAWNAPGRRLTESQAIALLRGPFPSATTSWDPNARTPYAHHVSAGFKQAIGARLSLSANLLYVHGMYQPGTLDYNPRIPSLGSPTRRPNDVNGVSGTSAPVNQFTSYARTWYSGLTIALQKAYSQSSQFLVSYTLSTAEDNATDQGNLFVPQNMGLGRNPADPTGLPLVFDPNADRGPAVWDQRHRLAISGLRQFPKGIQVSAIIIAASGRPFTPLAGVDLNGDGDAGGAPTDRARTNPADMATSVGRNSARLPAQLTVDVRLSRKFGIGRREGVALEPLVEVFNLFDRANYSDVNNVFGPGAFPNNPAVDAQGRVTYGTFTQSQPPRQIQLGVKFSF